jgi:DNA-binding NarL/FixJ family response regulator
VLLADDHAGNAALLRDLLEAAYDVVGEVADGSKLLAEVERLAPDVVVTDISMPGLDGIEASRRILARNPATRVVLVTVHTDPALVERGLAAGALGYVVKRVAGDELVPAIQAALEGKRCVMGVEGLGEDGAPRGGCGCASRA